MKENGLEPELETWLKKFEKNKGRNLRVLHIGNIAANGFLNAKFMRRYGIEADVLCYDYYHIMGYPEWEELLINDDYKQDIFPLFSKNDRALYQRPRWFIQGPLALCFEYLRAKHTNHFQTEQLWAQLNSFVFNEKVIPSPLFFKEKLKVKINYTKGRCYSLLRNIMSKRVHTFLKRILRKAKSKNQNETESLEQLVEKLNKLYKLTFPDRSYQFTAQDIEAYYWNQNDWKSIFKYYDVVQCYSTTPLLGVMFSDKPYVAFEHGTLRTFTSDDSALNALTALSYKKAAHAFITNGDCLANAQQLKMDNYSPMIHPIDVEQHRTRDERKIVELRLKYQADILLFCPLRHDWNIKGTDVHIRALPEINKLNMGSVILIMTNWGVDLEKSEELARSLGVAEQIIWIPPLCRLKMIEMIQMCDVVLDQTILPCFGSTAPQALSCGTPTIMSYRPETTEWIIKEPAPLIPAFNKEEVAQGIKLALDPSWRKQFEQRAKDWIDTYHSSIIAVNEHLKVYKKILEEAV